MNRNVDPVLKGRIQTYLEMNSNLKMEHLHSSDVIDYLKETYPRDYQRKTQFAMKNAVEKTLGSLQANRNLSIPPPKEKGKKSEGDNELNESLPQLVDGGDSNAMNRAIAQSYRSNKQKRNPNDREAEHLAGTPKKKKSESDVDKSGSKKQSLYSESERPAARYSDLGGIEAILEDIKEIVERPMTHPEIYLHLGVPTPRGVLLHGPTGCGKTLLAHAMAGELGVLFLKISAPEIVTGVSGESEAKIRQIFSQASQNSPCIIFIDEIDVITPNRGTSSRDMERRIVAQLITCMDELTLEKTGGKPVMVIGATNRPDSLDQALRRSGRFDREICLGVPDEDGREKILRTISVNLRLMGNFDFRALAKKTPGFVGADFQALSKEAATHAINRIFSTLEDVTTDNYDNEIEVPSCSEVETEERVDEMQLETNEVLDAIVANDISHNSNNHNNDAAIIESMNTEVPILPADEKLSLNLGGDSQREKAEQGSSGMVFEGKFRASRTTMQISNRSRTNEKMRSHGTYSSAQLAGLSITMEDFEYALHYVQPSALREGFATVPDTTWDQIGSLEDVKRELELSLLAPVQHRDKFEAVGLKSTSRGVLLYGPPGCGKTLVAKAMANECHLNFISVKGPELLNKYVGESEKAVRKVFERAKASSPCIIFFDELDALCPRRDAKENQVSARVVNQMLTALDGLDARKEIFIIAASNRPDMIDSAILRPGRLDNMIYLALPSPEDRVKILTTCIKNTPLAPDVNIEKIARDSRCTGFSGADIDLLHREAQTECIRLAIEQGQPLLVSNDHFEKALSKVIPSVTIQDENRYKKLNASIMKSRMRNPTAEQGGEQ